MTRVWDGYIGSGGSELLALLALADWSDDEGRCFPSIERIGVKTRLSRSQAQRVIHGLIERGYLVVTGNETGGKPGSSRRYRIVLSKLTGSAGATPTGRTGATGSANAQEGPHPCAERGSAGATLTVIDTSKNRQSVRKPMASSAAKLPICPVSDLISLYHEILPSLPAVRLETDGRKKALRKMWKWVLTSHKPDGSPRATTANEAMAWFHDYFERATENDFLMGRTQRSGEHANWRCDLDFLLTERGMKHVIEKTEVREEVAA